jgi:hypothetical protein
MYLLYKKTADTYICNGKFDSLARAVDYVQRSNNFEVDTVEIDNNYHLTSTINCNHFSKGDTLYILLPFDYDLPFKINDMFIEWRKLRV